MTTEDYPDPLTASLAFHNEMSVLLARNAERRARQEAAEATADAQLDQT